MKKKLYYIQAATTYNNKQSVYLPYSVGCLIAYSMSKPEIRASYQTEKIFFDRELPALVADEMDEPFLAAFSVCLWNIEYSKQLAAIVKERFPQCKIVFGGHSVTDGGELLTQNPYIDYLLHGEGEEPFAKLLLALDGKEDICSVPNLSYRSEGGVAHTENIFQPDISNYPSPYTEGVFDSIMAENPSVPFNAILETNRGCPYGCAYCEWCFGEAVRKFPMSKIKAELEWISSRKIEYCYCADANFGILPRDAEIAEYAASLKAGSGYPCVLRPTYANGGGDTVFKAASILNDCAMDKGVTISYQSLSEDVLKNIGRVNFSFEKNSELMRRLDAAGIATYSELILGLPGETYESFCRGLCKLIDMGNYSSISVYKCQVYGNSLLGNPQYRKKFGIKTSTVPILGIHYAADFNTIPEYFDIVTATDSMPFEKWVSANLFSAVVQTFHSNGLLRFFALYLHNEEGVDYYEFYNALLEYILSAEGTHLHSLFSGFLRQLSNTDSAQWVYRSKETGDIGWYFDEGAFLELAARLGETYAELTPFLRQFFEDNRLFEQLLLFQKEMVRRPFADKSEAEFDYDFYGYFTSLAGRSPCALTEEHCRLSVDIGKKGETMGEYAMNTILFGKRRGETLIFGKEPLMKWEKAAD